MADGASDAGIPEELKGKLASFDSSLSDIEKCLQPLLDVPENEVKDKLDCLDKAKLDLVGAYTVNSLFWMYLNVCGINPKEHPIKQELDRIRSYMNRVKEIQDKVNAPKLDKGAAKRFYKSALWQAAKTKTDPSTTADENRDDGPSTSAESTPNKTSKRLMTGDESDHRQRKKKKHKK